jgi:hypothetical protein
MREEIPQHADFGSCWGPHLTPKSIWSKTQLRSWVAGQPARTDFGALDLMMAELDDRSGTSSALASCGTA